jgi:SAM-dependent methyltransferase
MMWHHFTYMVISIGLLGFGASGSLLTATRLGEKKGAAERALVWTSVGYGISVVLAFCFTTFVRIDSLSLKDKPENALALFLIYLIVFVPFLLGGLGIGLALTRFVKSVNKLYFGDLVGSAVGASLSVLALKAFGGSAAVVIAGCFGLIAAFCFSFATPRRYLVLSVPGLFVGLWLFLGFTGMWPTVVSKIDWKVPYAVGKEAATLEAVLADPEKVRMFGLEDATIVKLPSATAEVEVGPHVPLSKPMIGGDMGVVDAIQIPSRAVGQDGAAPTMLYKDAANLANFPFLDDTQAASAYVAHKASGRTDQKSMVIGVGGGVDVLVALANGAKHVTAVELNTAMIDMVTEKYDEYLGGLFTTSPLAKQIDLVNSEGRAWLRSHEDKYDVIQMSGVDSYTALSGGAYTLSESYLYTVEAIQEFYEHLNPDGIVCYSRFMLKAPKAARETLRLANIAVEGLRKAGVPMPHKHVCVLRGGIDWASTMIKQSPFTEAEVEALRAFARREVFAGLMFDPLMASDAEIEPLPEHFSVLAMKPRTQLPIYGVAGVGAAGEEALRAFCAAAAEVAKGKAVSVQLLPEAMRSQPVAQLIVAQLKKFKPQIHSQAAYFKQTITDFRDLLFAAGPSKDAFYDRYPFDVQASTDDSPFFFNFYKWSSLFGSAWQAKDVDAFNYQTDFPTGHFVLLVSMVQILLIAALLIFLPLRKLRHDGVRVEGTWRIFSYFAALGLGFMLFEIALMQKLVIFLGHPTYALSVVLTSLLASAGLGSLLAGRVQVIRRSHLMMMLVCVLAAILSCVFVVNNLLPQLLGLALWMRVMVVVLMLVPTGMLLGMPFPTGLRLVQDQCPHLIPWGWAINAFFSVLGSIVCIVLSMAIGFSNVFYVAAAVYVVGIALMKAPRGNWRARVDTDDDGFVDPDATIVSGLN